jgi:hypothetical protein
MISNPAKRGPVRIEREGASTVISTTRNPYAVDNVNVAQGPRTGNPGLAASKRSDFIAAKEAREPLATMIQDAYVARAHEYKEFEYTNGGSIHDNTRAEFNQKVGITRTAKRR